MAKLLARAGIASRRDIERMIADGRIALDGKVLDTPATLLTSLRGVTVDGKPVAEPAPARLFRYHKPAGLLTTERDPAGRPTIYDSLPEGLPRVMPVGRLDLSTEGLLLLTTDGELKRELELPATGVERSYRARAYGNVTQAQLEALMLGVEIEGVRYGSINANIERRTGANVWIELTLTEGKNREVRRVLEYLGLEVNRLIRTRYGPFYLGDMPAGDVDEIRKVDLVTFRTVLSKPGGGKAASNLQFSVRSRVVEPAPRPKPVPTDGREPDSRRKLAKPAPAPKKPVFTARQTPRARDEEERPRSSAKPGFAPRGERPVRNERSEERPRGPGKPGFAPRGERPARGERQEERPRSPGKFAPRKPREEGPANPARAARARAHREAREPQPGDFVDRPKGPRRPDRGPAAGRGKPARPPRTRK
ncbi:pseudouridine synthase [Sphingomonas sp. HITSZ_GF]|uniref:pseudouridine synthase n=1 Tax=Sphingomonas sp. HITSZ_GF TaxID=3037247 RepID=UPI00240DFE26|nr:pseudouridine synthase [Sphingomonas sp. HITSZ_GF]MDG2532895.1 pseudouridine synthase [Sphingomonas sp. HITSZ_GF]